MISHSCGSNLTRLEQDGIRNADLADIVHGTGVENQVTVGFRSSLSRARARRHMAHAQDVVAGFLVTIFRRHAQPLYHFQAGTTQFLGA